MDEIEYLGATSTIQSYNLFAYCEGNPVNMVDPNGHLSKLAEWLIGGVCIVAAVALIVVTAGVCGAIATALGGILLATIGSGVVAGAVVGAASGALVNTGTQLITKDSKNFSYIELGNSALRGAAAGAISGGLFLGIQYWLSASKIANGVSGLGKAQTRLNNAFKPLGNVRNLASLLAVQI